MRCRLQQPTSVKASRSKTPKRTRQCRGRAPAGRARAASPTRWPGRSTPPDFGERIRRHRGSEWISKKRRCTSASSTGSQRRSTASSADGKGYSAVGSGRSSVSIVGHHRVSAAAGQESARPRRSIRSSIGALLSGPPTVPALPLYAIPGLMNDARVWKSQAHALGRGRGRSASRTRRRTTRSARSRPRRWRARRPSASRWRDSRSAGMSHSEVPSDRRRSASRGWRSSTPALGKISRRPPRCVSGCSATVERSPADFDAVARVVPPARDACVAGRRPRR